ncbi:MAG: triose-phosphate isomerase [Candidatus Kapabacteria bacterium]|nr:triose-phosphate isomerase [Candidatus Kapabacteria bacterium]
MRTKVIAGNWKMNTNPEDATELVKKIVSSASVQLAPSLVRVVVCPPYLSLANALIAAGGTSVSIGAQNCHHEEKGAYTGEVSPVVLAGMGLGYVIVGHSERRRYQLESNEIIGRKAARAHECGLTPIICVGETLDEREDDITTDVIGTQIRLITASAGEDVVKASVIAYEPVWAIGTGRAATPLQAQDAHAFIRSELHIFGAQDVSILYGGSVTDENASLLFSCPDIDGALVGGASLNADSFCSIVGVANEAAR